MWTSHPHLQPLPRPSQSEAGLASPFWGLLESAEDHGMWKHAYGVQQEILKKMALDMEEYFGLIHLLPTIRRVYEDLLEQAQKEACEDAKKTGEVAPADAIMMQAMKLVEMAADDKRLNEVSFLFYLVYNCLDERCRNFGGREAEGNTF